MLQQKHTVITQDVTAEQVWKVWSDVDNWSSFDSDLEWTKAPDNFKFAPGHYFYLKPKGGPKVKIIISDITLHQTFTDYVEFFGARMTDAHELKQTAAGLEISNTISVRGPLAWLWRKLVAEKVAAGIPEQTQRLIELAKTK